MQLMTWTLARLGSRFSLMFEPQHRRIRHSALGRFFDQPSDLKVGLVDPDGTERVLPFTMQGVPLYNPEQFERLNSITFRGFSERYRLRFEFNVHSVFYPQDEELCSMPAFYLEMRVNPVRTVQNLKPTGPIPKRAKLFIRLHRSDTHIAAASDGKNASIDLAYRCTLPPARDGDDQAPVDVRERIVSLNPGPTPDADGCGLTLEVPVTEPGSGIKWRLVWGAHCDSPIGSVGPVQGTASLRYLQHWPDLDAVMDDAIRLRDDRLAHSRRLERLIDQAPLSMAQRHLLNQSFQTFLSNTCWCQRPDGSQWFGTWGNPYNHQSAITVGYYSSPLYLALWPRLLAMQLDQWARYEVSHEPSSGGYLRDNAPVKRVNHVKLLDREDPLETTCNYLLAAQAYTHWTADLTLVQQHAQRIDRLAAYLTWADRDDSGFPSIASAASADDPDTPLIDAGKQTHLAVKRLAALQAAADMLARSGHTATAGRCQNTVDADTNKLEQKIWLRDHYALCLDQDTALMPGAWVGDAPSMGGALAPIAGTPVREAYSINTGNALLLPAITAQPLILDPTRLRIDLVSAARETLAAYGCGSTSDDIEDIWISQNVWRDHLSVYLGAGYTTRAQRYWDLQVTSNTHLQSQGYCDSYVAHLTPFDPCGAVCFGFLLAGPRLVIDRLAPGGTRISVEPNRHIPQRWPLLPLADWKAARVPVCVVDSIGNVFIESESDPVIVHGGPASCDIIG